MKPFLTLAMIAAATAAGLTGARAGIFDKHKREKDRDDVPSSGSASYRPASKPDRKDRPGVPDKDRYPDRYPETRPVERPEALPGYLEPERPSSRPGSGNGLPSQGGNDSRPSWPGRPSTRPWEPEPDRPQWRPEYPRPDKSSTKPAKPNRDDEDFLDFRPSNRPDRPSWRPEDSRPFYKPYAKPWPVAPGINLPRPDYNIHRPRRPQNRPAQVTNIWQNHTQVWNQWTVQNNVTINNFVINRPTAWQNVNRYASSGDCWKRWQQPDWWEWRSRLWDYRRHRCEELWNRYYWLSDQLFDSHWWSYCSWATQYGRPAGVPDWWWWTPVTWQQLTAHVKKLPSEQEPLVFDPGVSVVIYGDRVYVNGRDEGSARKFVESARNEANPDFRWEPPFPGGRHEWLPLGVWALSQEEQGEATMFVQLSISRDGLISGGFTNVLTGEDYPIAGGTNRREQRVAWHIGSETDTVMECGLAHLTHDVAGMFVHFSRGISQTWIMARLPAPGFPPGPVRIPWLDRR